MKVLTYMQGGHKAVGILKKNRTGSGSRELSGLRSGEYDGIHRFHELKKKCANWRKTQELMDGIPMEEVRLLSPIVHPKQDVICLGINYYAHAEEAARFHDEAFGGERPQPHLFL